MAIKFSQFNLRTDHTSGMYLVGYDGNQNIHITVDNLFDDFINGTENTIAMFGTDGTVLADSILSQDAGATLLTVAGQLNVDAAATFDTSLTVTGDSTLNGNVTLGDASTDLITQNGTLYLNGPVKDTTNTLGAADQVLLSDAAGELTFTDLAGLHVGGAEVVEVPVKNVQGSALVKGDPVYISGSVGASGRLEVQLADASNTLKMPAVGLLKQDLANNAEGFAVVTGKLRNLITDPIDGVTPTENDVIYVKPSGTSGNALTTTKPVYGNFIQNMGKVGRVSGGNSGTFVVSSILRTNDIPNLTPGRLWIGSTGNTIESQTLFVDEANARLGIGTASPSTKLDVDGDITSRGDIIIDAEIGDPFLKLQTPAQEYNLRIDRSDNEKFQIRDITNSETRVTLETSGNIGLGTTSPFASLHIKDDTNNPGILVESSQTTGANFQNSYINLRAQETSTNTTTSGSIIMHGVNTLNAAGPKTLQIRNLSLGGADVLITTYDNTNTALNPARFKSSGQVQFEEYGSGSFTGTATKTLAVDINGNVIETAGVSVDGSGTANYVTKWLDTDTITDSVIYDDGTNVGIGQTNPSRLLHVAAASSTAIVTLQRTNTNTTGGLGALQWTANDDHSVASISVVGDGNNEGGHMDFRTTSAATNNDPYSNSYLPVRMRITSSGNVGIGTDSPDAKLEVNDSANDLQMRVGSLTAGISPYIRLQGKNTANTTNYYTDIELDAENGKLIFNDPGTSGGSIGTNPMVIDSSGNVGIGENDPDRQLHLKSSLPAIRLEDSDVSGLYHEFFASTAGLFQFKADGGNVQANSGFLFQVDNSEKMRIDSAGTVTFEIGAKFKKVGGAFGSLLNYYQRGTFTPIYTGTTVYSYGIRYGYYERIGDLVHVQLEISTGYTSGAGTGIAKIGGLPFTVGRAVCCPMYVMQPTGTMSDISLMGPNFESTKAVPVGVVGTTTIQFEYTDKGSTGKTVVTPANFFRSGGYTNGNHMQVTISYLVT